MDRASDFRMREGFCVPIHTSGGHEAIVTMAGERVELSGQVRPALHLMALSPTARPSICACRSGSRRRRRC